MCGIVGIYNYKTNAPISPTLLQDMCETLVHRGPDDAGYFTDQALGLAMRRLSVIDVKGGQQPQTNETNTCHIVFNGEIYNYPELRTYCHTHGHTLKTQSDTETILHLYEDKGDDCVQSLNGMFAFALYDAPKRRLLIARDRLGIKPLYYAETANGLLFGSEIKALVTHPDIPSDLDPIALDYYLTYKYTPSERTIYRAIRKLPPGHTLTIENGRLKISPYWKLSFEKQPQRSEAEIAEELLQRLKTSVQMQMLSDVPLGALLSGGIDSSLIVGLMNQLSDQPIKTFSIGFEEQSYNELDAARQVAQHYQTEHHEEIVRPQIQHLFDQIQDQLDEPFGDSSIIPTYLVSQLARKHVTVALSGTGADELFAGYERYWAIPLTKAYRHIPKPLRQTLSWSLGKLNTGHTKKSLILRAQKFTKAAEATALARHQRVIELFSEEQRSALYQADWIAQQTYDSTDPFMQAYAASNATHELDRLLDVDTKTLLSEDYLVKDDRASMATSLELRVPFLDHTFVEFAASLPSHLKLRRLTTKYILKKAAKDILPQNILQRPKQGFEIPIAHWLATDLKDRMYDLLQSPQAQINTLFNAQNIEHYITEHTSGRQNHSRQLWSLMSLEMWLRKTKQSAKSQPELPKT